MHPVEASIRKWSKDFLEVPNEKLNGMPPCPYAQKAWAENQVMFSINSGLDGLADAVRDYNELGFDIIVWASEELPDIEYLDGWCDGMNEALSIAGKDTHLMVFHPNYDAEDAGLDFLIHDEQEDLEYCMVFVQRLSKLDDAAVSLEKSGYYKHFPDDVFESLVLARRNLRYGNEEN